MTPPAGSFVSVCAADALLSVTVSDAPVPVTVTKGDCFGSYHLDGAAGIFYRVVRHLQLIEIQYVPVQVNRQLCVCGHGYGVFRINVPI